MGVKELWSVLTPYADRKPLNELRGKTVAIDLAGWVCESLNVVDYFVHPRHHLKNLFFRTCYLIWEGVTPIFVLEGLTPDLKKDVVAKRNEIQFRGVKPKEKLPKKGTNSNDKQTATSAAKGRTRFNHVLKQCQTLLNTMGIECIQGPGEAEAYCAFLNRKELVDGVISQDSDCFAYGAIRVYRNFSVSTQGAQSAQGGSVDIYDMEKIKKDMDIGQNKIIAMALLCGCDYCPDGIGGIGRDGVLKLFAMYTEKEILNRLKHWRQENHKYTELEIRVDDKNICSLCGHIGKTQAHTKNGCGLCRTNSGCDESVWKEQRLTIKAELTLRKKALKDPKFPCEEIIEEFLSEPSEIPKLNLTWKQPNIVKFIKKICHLLQWTELYGFQKCLPVLTRWQVRHGTSLNKTRSNAYVVPKEIIKKRTLKGVASLEILWHDEEGFFNGLIPDEQLQSFINESQSLDKLWTTVEPLISVEKAYPILLAEFLVAKQKPQKTLAKSKKKNKENIHTGSLENLKDLVTATEEIAQNLKSKCNKKPMRKNPPKGVQMIDRFFKEKQVGINFHKEKKTASTATIVNVQCSTPKMKFVPSDLDSDDDCELNLSAVIDDIVRKPKDRNLLTYTGRTLQYESTNLVLAEKSLSHSVSKDDLEILWERKRNNSTVLERPQCKRMSMDDSFDLLVKAGNARLNDFGEIQALDSPISRFKLKHNLLSKAGTTTKNVQIEDTANSSYFFTNADAFREKTTTTDLFEQIMEASFGR